jgi:PPOX class probable FMN-dependent enzyme
MLTERFGDTITSESELRQLVGEPGELAVKKELTYLDRHCRAFIARSPFAVVGTVGASGRCDVSPRGDAPGFVQVLDERTLAIPERPGNRRLDTLINVLQTGRVGLLFLIPGIEETLRVNGRACLLRDPAILEGSVVQGKRPLLAIGVEAEECFLHCAKALKRSHLWQTDQWPSPDAVPTLARMLFDQIHPAHQSVDDLAASIEESYAKRLY